MSGDACGRCWPWWRLRGRHARSVLLDGLPLNGRAEALLLGLVVPALLWFAPRILQRNVIRVAIVALLALKIAGLALTPQGLCARFSTTAPFVGETHTIPIDEPQGWLRSWDVRANWRDTNPTCTAIVDRAYADSRSFPAWFVNLVDSIRPGRDLVARADGYLHVSDAGVFSMPVAPDMRVEGEIGGQSVAQSGASIVDVVAAGRSPDQVARGLDRRALEPAAAMERS